MLRLKRTLVLNCAAFFHRGREVLGVIGNHRREYKVNHRAHVGRRSLVKKARGVSGQSIPATLLRQKAHDDQIVAKDSRASFRCVARFGNFFRGGLAVGDGTEQTEFDSRLDCFRALVSIKSIEKQCRGWLTGSLVFWSHSLFLPRSKSKLRVDSKL